MPLFQFMGFLAIGGIIDGCPAGFAVDFAKIGSETIGGKGGGGRPDFAQAGGIESSKIDEALEKFKSLI